VAEGGRVAEPPGTVILIGSATDLSCEARDLFPTACIVSVPTLEEGITWLLESAHGAAVHAGPVVVDGLEVDLEGHQATWRGRSLPLSELDLKILACLAADAGRLRTFADLIACCWGDRSLGDRARLQAAVKRLRVRLARIAPTVRIEAVRGAGFRLMADLGRHRAVT
jgi:DNA-binding response OmpR family regulator